MLRKSPSVVETNSKFRNQKTPTVQISQCTKSIPLARVSGRMFPPLVAHLPKNHKCPTCPPGDYGCFICCIYCRLYYFLPSDLFSSFSDQSEFVQSHSDQSESIFHYPRSYSFFLIGGIMAGVGLTFRIPMVAQEICHYFYNKIATLPVNLLHREQLPLLSEGTKKQEDSGQCQQYASSKKEENC